MDNEATNLDVADLANRQVLASIRLTRWLRSADPAPKLTWPQASALAVIIHAGPIRMSDLARIEEVSRPTITLLAGELEGMSLISRTRDSGDARVSRLQATHAGEDLFAAGHARRLAPFCAAIGELTEGEQRALREGLAVLERLLRAHPTVK